MAKLIPALNSCLRQMQAGERRFARRLESHLEDDYLCWYELPVGARQRYTDFIILHPGRGLLLLEVKDWKLDTLQKMDRKSATLLTSSGPKVVANPLEQARQCTYQLVNQLQADSQLVFPQGRYQGKLVFPYGYGVVLSNITRRQFENTDLDEVLPSHQVICKDEMTESVDPEAFQKRLWDMFNVPFSQPAPLSLPQIDRIRWHLFPEIRIPDNQADLFQDCNTDDPASLLPDIVKVMDMQQEQLARSLGEGHRVIHGVAGSGKTLILGYRCLHLARALNKPILVLCYNITLAARLRSLLQELDIQGKVNVYHFHDWCGEQLRNYHVARPEAGKDYAEQLVTRVIEAVDQGQIPKGQYGAVMIDEGHDFAPDWLRLVVDMVDPDSNSLLLLYDDAQSIYHNGKTLDFSLSSVGIQARGRTTVLRLNYRNTEEILGFAYRFAQQYLSATEQDEDHVPLIEPESAGRRGSEPAIRLFASFDEEARYIAHLFRQMHAERDTPWADMCVTYPANWMGEILQRHFEAAGIPCHWLHDSQSKRRFRPNNNSVKLMTMHSSKGLEFPLVAVAGVGFMPQPHAEPSDDAKLLYVAMTRATENLLITSHRQNTFWQQLQA